MRKYCIGLFLIGLGIFGAGLIGLISKKDNTDFLSNVILFETGVVLLWYSMETRRLKLLQKEANLNQYKQLKLLQDERKEAVRPFLRLNLSEKTGEIFELENLGKGAAVSVHLEPFTIEPDYTVAVKGESVIAAGESVSLQLVDLQGFRGLIRESVLKQINANKFPLLSISYLDLNGRPYDAHFKPRKDYSGKFEVYKQEARKTRPTKLKK